MKALNILLSVFFLAATFSVSAQTKKDTVKVWGNCGMCKKTIEKAATTAGATAVNWNTETKILSVSYDAKKTTNKKIQQAIAAAGYDTQDETASDEAYNKLHGCCQYERKAATAAGKDDKACCAGNDGAHGKECKKDHH